MSRKSRPHLLDINVLYFLDFIEVFWLVIVLRNKMKTKRWTMLDLRDMSRIEFDFFNACLKYKAFRLIDIPWHENIQIYIGLNGDVIFDYD